MMYVTAAKNGEMHIKFSNPLKIVGCDEFNVFLKDGNHIIDGLPYITIFSKEWIFTDALTGCDISFEVATY